MAVPVPAAGRVGGSSACWGILPNSELPHPPAFWCLHSNGYSDSVHFELCPLWGAVFWRVGEWRGHWRLAKSVADKSWNYFREDEGAEG